MRARISVLVLLLGLLLITLNRARNEKLLEGRSLARMEREAWVAGTRLAGMMQHLFRKEQHRAAELEMSYAPISMDLELGLVCDRQDEVRCSTRLQWRGLRLPATPFARDARLAASARDSMDGVIQWDAGHDRLMAVFPFFASYDSSNRGVVMLAYDSSFALARARADALHESMVQACVLAATCLLLWLALDWLVARRVELVLDFTRAVKEGGEPPLAIKGGDELAVIAGGFAEAVNKVHETQSRLMEASEAERRRIGRDIHDDVCQRLAAAQLKSGVLSSALAHEQSAHTALAAEVAAELREAAAVARVFARGLAPVWVEQEGLAAALDELAAQLSQSFGIRCESEYDLGVRPLAAWVQTHVFRIVQELATNAAKHAKPSHVVMRVKLNGGALRIEVENDGLAFPSPASQTGGLGIIFIQQRVRALGGRLLFQPREDGRGTLALCEAELSANHFSDQTDHP